MVAVHHRDPQRRAGLLDFRLGGADDALEIVFAADVGMVLVFHVGRVAQKQAKLAFERIAAVERQDLGPGGKNGIGKKPSRAAGGQHRDVVPERQERRNAAADAVAEGVNTSLVDARLGGQPLDGGATVVNLAVHELEVSLILVFTAQARKQDRVAGVEERLAFLEIVLAQSETTVKKDDRRDVVGRRLGGQHEPGRQVEVARRVCDHLDVRGRLLIAGLFRGAPLLREDRGMAAAHFKVRPVKLGPAAADGAARGQPKDCHHPQSGNCDSTLNRHG